MTPITPASTLFGASQAASGNTAAAPAAPSNSPTESQFLQLLVAQLKNQDPTSPSDPTQFIGELAQFSQVEQGVTIAANTTTMTQQLGQIITPATPDTSNTGTSKTGN